MSKHNSINIKWNLSCSQDEAVMRLSDSFKKDFGMGWHNIKGEIENKGFKIWINTPGMRGYSIAIGKGKIVSKQNNTSQLLASLSISWPFYYFNLSKKIMIFVVLSAISAWCLSLTGALFSQYEKLSEIFFPIGFCSILIIILSFIRYLGESELNDLKSFIDKSFSIYREHVTH